METPRRYDALLRLVVPDGSVWYRQVQMSSSVASGSGWDAMTFIKHSDGVFRRVRVYLDCAGVWDAGVLLPIYHVNRHEMTDLGDGISSDQSGIGSLGSCFHEWLRDSELMQRIV